ncbi:MAG TPA: tetratricopeptide repeat protein [Chthoniobacterales bacterium]|nr:tetratricopeptide repeat protein [Chthoniobacterales bacterium]
MQPERAERIADIVERALEAEIGRRGPLLVELCGDDQELFVEVASLLHFQEKARDFIETPAVETAAELLADERTGLRPGDSLDGYRIISLIGEGGMGEVYLAQDAKLERKVAIKLLKLGLGTANIIRHFHQDERILAGLTHPNIAQLYGGDVTKNGLAYFVMEYVDGVRLDDYCRDQQLSIVDRLELFRKICSAVTYAHQRLVIHRDLKPANIRVTSEGEPKLLDFGITKLLDPATSAIEATIRFAAVMTSDYASPEQVRGENITTTSDVYSLGVVLYELLTEQKPYKINNRTPTAVARAITDQQPTKPSAAVARRDGSSSLQIPSAKSLGGDLDNIVMMALRKEPVRRYSSVAQLSEDIRRHLDGRTVIARKDTLGYRSAKFVTRHRLGVAAAVLILLSLIGGIVATASQARKTRLEKARAESINAFLEQMLSYSNPVLSLSQHNGQKTTIGEVLDEAAKRLESREFSNQPEVKAELERIIAQSYRYQGRHDLAIRHLQEYVSLQSKLYRPNDPKMLAASASRALLLFDKGELPEAERIYRQFLPLMRQEYRKGNIKTETLAEALNTFGYVRRTQGNSREAESLFREVLALTPKLPSESRYLIGLTRSTLALTLADQGQFPEALQAAREAVADYRKRGETSIPDFGFALTILGGFLTEEGNFVEGDAALREAEAIFRQRLNSAHLWLGDNLRNQALSLYQQSKYAEALNKVTETLSIYRESFGPHYDQYPTALIIQGLILAKTGKPKEGERILREAVRIRTESLPKEHFWVAMANNALGECLTIQKRFTEAEPLLLSSYESLKNSQGPHNPRTGIALQRLIALYEAWGKPEQAARYR